MIPILYSDDALVAVDKPPGVAVVPAGGEAPGECLRHALERQLGAPLWVVHRLDRGTSGVVVFARTADEHRRLNALFEQRAVSKTYLALTAGIPTPVQGRIEVALHAARKGRTRPCAPGEPGLAAVTDYDVLRTWSRRGLCAALVEARPRTGRHHQIRVHLRAIGAPILGDDIYGRTTLTGEWESAACPRLALHAWRVDLPPDGGGPSLRLESPFPADLAAVAAGFDAAWDAGTARPADGRATSSLP